MKSRTVFLFKVVPGTLLLCLLGPLALDVQIASPITLQSLVIILLSVLVGWQAGVTSIAAYLALGAAGLPVFANFNSGLGVFAGPSAGFLFGFLLVGLLAGWWAARLPNRYLRFLVLFVSCHLLLLVFGTIGFVFAGLEPAQIQSTLAGLLPGLLLKSLAGALLSQWLMPGGPLHLLIPDVVRRT